MKIPVFSSLSPVKAACFVFVFVGSVGFVNAAYAAVEVEQSAGVLSIAEKSAAGVAKIKVTGDDHGKIFRIESLDSAVTKVQATGAMCKKDTVLEQVVCRTLPGEQIVNQMQVETLDQADHVELAFPDESFPKSVGGRSLTVDTGKGKDFLKLTGDVDIDEDLAASIAQVDLSTGKGNDQVEVGLTHRDGLRYKYAGRLDVDLGGDNDQFNGEGTTAVPFQVVDGEGNDIVLGSKADVKSYDVRTEGWTLPVYDLFLAGSTADGADEFGGPIGHAEVSYEKRMVPVSVSLDGNANDGAVAENDNVSPSVNVVRGTAMADTIDVTVKSMGTPVYIGREVYGGDGNDTITAANMPTGVMDDGRQLTSGNILDGEEGDDTISGVPTAWSGQFLHEWLIGGPGNDVLNSNGTTYSWSYLASDILVGGDGQDTLNGGDGQELYLLAGTSAAADASDTVKETGTDNGHDCVSYQSVMTTKFPYLWSEHVPFSVLSEVPRSGTVAITLDGVANDGAVGEGDNIGSGIEEIHGGDGDDTISQAVYKIYGKGGRDTLAGAEHLNGGGDDDTLRASPGLSFQQQLDGGEGSDRLIGSDNGERFIAGGGDDAITAGRGDDEIFDGPGNDRVVDTGGKNTIHLEEGDDSLITGDGDDNVADGDGSDHIQTGGGADSVFFAAEDPANRDHIETGEGADKVSPSGGSSGRYGNQGSALIETGAGDDKVWLGPYREYSQPMDATVHAGSGNDVVYARNATGDDGNDLLFQAVYGYYSSVSEKGGVLDGGAGNDTVVGGLGAEFGAYKNYGQINSPLPDLCRTDGSNVDDHLIGGDGDDLLIGLPGKDTLEGGSGDDQLGGGQYECGKVSNKLVPTFISGLGRESVAETLAGGDGNDQLSVQNDDRVDGGSGEDQIDIYSSNKPKEVGDLHGGDGIDQVNYTTTDGSSSSLCGVQVSLDDQTNDGSYGSTLSANPSQLHNVHSDVENISGSTCRDYLVGSAAANTLLGVNGSDTIDGGAGQDVLDGGDADRGKTSGSVTIHARDGEADRVNCGRFANQSIFGSAYTDAQDEVANCKELNPDQRNSTTNPGTKPGSSSQDPCVVPKLIGLDNRDAYKALSKANCQMSTKGWWVSSATRAGKVLRQNYAQGKRLAHNDWVTVTVGRKTTKRFCHIRRVKGKSISAAYSALNSQQCNIVIKNKRVRSKRLWGRVLSQSVSGKRRSATTVTITVGMKP